jgi:hypothetical protein
MKFFTYKLYVFFILIFCIFLIPKNLVFAATGDITGVRITSDGWYAELDIEGFSTGGTADYGFVEDSFASTTDNDPSGAKVVFTVTSQGYNTSGTLGTITRTVYGTKTVRKAFPTNVITDRSVLDEAVSGGVLTLKVALSDYIYSDDEAGAGKSGTDVTVSIPSTFYRDNGSGGTNSYNNAATNLTVTNNSTLNYPKVIGRWAWPGYERVTSDFLVEAVAFHRFGQNSKPVAAVAFSASDQSGHTSRATTTDMTLTTRTGDTNPVLVYAATMDIDVLNQAEVIDVNFIAYPWVGDETSILNSAVGGDGYAQPDERLGTLSQLNDKAGTYGIGYAYVNRSTGNDATGAVYSSQTLAEAGNPFLTIGAAGAALKTYHNSNGVPTRNNAGGGVILLAEGNHPFPGTVPSSDLGTTMDTWLIVRPASTAAKANTKISSGSGSALKATRLKIQGVTLSPSVGSGGGLTGRTAGDVMWLHDNTINATTSSPIFSWRTLYGTQNSITSFATGFSSYAAGQRAPWALVRGNTSSSNITAQFYNILGNKGVTGANFIETGDVEVVTGGMASSTNAIFAFNTLFNMSTAVVWSSTSTTTGIAIIQNLFERVAGDAQGTMDISAGNDNGATTTNFLLWHNTLVGGRQQFAYNSSGSVRIPKLNYSTKFNIFLDQGLKTDTFTGAGGGDGARTGNWPIVYGVGTVGDRSLKNSFGGDFNGLFSGRQISTGGAFYLPGFKSDLSQETGANTGNGDYSLTSTSMVIDTATTTSSFYSLLPYDLLGNPRYGGPDSGAFEYQPSYTMGTHQLATSSSIRVYGDEKWRSITATSSNGTADMSVSLPGTDYTQWLDIRISNWQNSGTRQKTWTETSSTTALTNTVHVIGDLEANKNYSVSLDGVVGTNITGSSCTSGVCTSDSSGKITFTYTGTYSTHTFSVSEQLDTTAPTITNISSDKANGTYTIGDIVDIDVTFSENVTSTGSVTVTLETGDTDRTCTFTISNSNSGSCDYTVQSGDTSSDLNVKTISGTISDSSNNALSNFTPAVNLSTNKDLVINTSSNSSSDSSSDSSNRTKSTSLARKIASLIKSGNVKLAQDFKEQYTAVNDLDNSTSQNRTNYLFRRSLGKGSAGEEVRKLQEILSKDKNIYPEGLITGYFGNLTEKAVRRYQIQHNIALENDPGFGFVGPKTRAMLNQIK